VCTLKYHIKLGSVGLVGAVDCDAECGIVRDYDTWMNAINVFPVVATVVTLGAMAYFGRAWEGRWFLLLAIPIVWWGWKVLTFCVALLYYMYAARGV
jgi:hypothetical protein